MRRGLCPPSVWSEAGGTTRDAPLSPMAQPITRHPPAIFSCCVMSLIDTPHRITLFARWRPMASLTSCWRVCVCVAVMSYGLQAGTQFPVYSLLD
ncbi:hypothetical protein LZ30DRAFT_743133 [Colletotrichum cereale]|nr:hypothetical protein LZ30DRAFT_743133 [Colletotrichum cereale]